MPGLTFVIVGQLAYPILVGRQQPEGHPDYPRMGNFFHLQGGGGKYPQSPSLPTNRAAAGFLKEKAGFSAQAQEEVLGRTVAGALQSITAIQVSLRALQVPHSFRLVHSICGWRAAGLPAMGPSARLTGSAAVEGSKRPRWKGARCVQPMLMRLRNRVQSLR
jgi:hypothetical protein